MGFDGAATFSGKHNGVHSLLDPPHALYAHYHLLQLAYVQPVNHTADMKDVYTTLTSLWTIFSQEN